MQLFRQIGIQYDRGNRFASSSGYTLRKYFRLAFEPQTLAGFPSHFTVDISDTLESKIQSIQCYETQFPPEKAYVFDRIRGAAMLAGAASGFQAGEDLFQPLDSGPPALGCRSGFHPPGTGPDRSLYSSGKQAFTV